MDHAAAVRVLQRVAQRHADPQDVAVAQLALRDELVEGAPAHQLGHEVDRVVVATCFVEGDDAGVCEPRGRERLPLRARRILPRHADALERDRAVELLVVCEPDDAEPAGSEAAHEAVAIEHERLARASRDHLRRLLGSLHRITTSSWWAGVLPVNTNVHATPCRRSDGHTAASGLR